MVPGTSISPVRYESVAVVHLPDGAAEPVHVQLLADNPSAGDGSPRPSPQWYGRLQWLRPGVRVGPRTELCIELDNGRTGVALAKPAPAVADVVNLDGLGPPPFDVQ